MKLQILILLVLLGCNNNVNSPAEYEEWKTKRKSALYAEDGYLNLAGLYPIEDGNYTVGYGDHNDIRFPVDFSVDFGNVEVEDSSIIFNFNESVYMNDSIESKSFKYNYYENRNNFSYGSFIWYVHMDSGVKGIRLRNIKHPLLDNDLNNLSEAGLRAFEGFNMNEVFINPKKLTKVGFFERLFHIFS